MNESNITQSNLRWIKTSRVLCRCVWLTQPDGCWIITVIERVWSTWPWKCFFLFHHLHLEDDSFTFCKQNFKKTNVTDCAGSVPDNILHLMWSVWFKDAAQHPPAEVCKWFSGVKTEEEPFCCPTRKVPEWLTDAVFSYFSWSADSLIFMISLSLLCTYLCPSVIFIKNML